MMIMPKESVLKLSNMHNVQNGSFYIYKILVQHCVSFGDRVPDIFVSARRRSDGVAVSTTSFGNAALA